jgi:hypothetical protein
MDGCVPRVGRVCQGEQVRRARTTRNVCRVQCVSPASPLVSFTGFWRACVGMCPPTLPFASDKECSACGDCSSKFVNVVGTVPSGIPAFMFPGA